MKQKLLAAALALAMLFALLPAAAWAEEGQPTGQTPAAAGQQAEQTPAAPVEPELQAPPAAPEENKAETGLPTPQGGKDEAAAPQNGGSGLPEEPILKFEGNVLYTKGAPVTITANQNGGIDVTYMRTADQPETITYAGSDAVIFGGGKDEEHFDRASITLNSGMQKYGGDLYVGTITILQSIMQMLVLPLQGVTQGTQPIISYNYGAKNYHRVRQTFKRVLAISLGYTIAAFLLVSVFARPLARMFTPDQALIALTAKAAAVFFGGVWAFGAQMACQAAFMGLGQARVILLVPLAILLPLLFGGEPMAIYVAEPISDFLASATTLTLFFSRYKRLLPLPAPCAETDA